MQYQNPLNPNKFDNILNYSYTVQHNFPSINKLLSEMKLKSSLLQTKKIKQKKNYAIKQYNNNNNNKLC